MKNIICSACVMILMSFAPFEVYSTDLLHRPFFSPESEDAFFARARGIMGNTTKVDPKLEVWTAELIGNLDGSPQSISSDGTYLFYQTFSGKGAEKKFKRLNGSKWEDVGSKDAPKLPDFIPHPPSCPPPHDFGEPSGVPMSHRSQKPSKCVELSRPVGGNMYKVVDKQLMRLDGKEWKPIGGLIPTLYKDPSPWGQRLYGDGDVEDIFSDGKSIYITIGETYDDGRSLPAGATAFPHVFQIMKFNEEACTWTAVARPLHNFDSFPYSKGQVSSDKNGGFLVFCGGKLIKINGCTGDWSFVKIHFPDELERLSRRSTCYHIANGDLYAIVSKSQRPCSYRSDVDSSAVDSFAVYKCVPPSTSPCESSSSSSSDV
ncbi:hypothetical protein FACS1894122_05830 [Alphaproteobacteria bacterium]|nr:hypothetical protein FACS1894122_05830 [Alphaproteobacteria bacterium]